MNSTFQPRFSDPGLSPVRTAVAGLLVSFFVYLSVSYFRSPLRRYPGPFLAKFTNLWRLWRVTKGNIHKELIDLHKKHGPVVRVGPNIINVDYPELIKTVFSIKDDWKKTEMYLGSSSLVDGKIVYNLFSQLDKKEHAREKRPIAKFYSPNFAMSLEPHVNTIITQFCNELETRFMPQGAPGKPVDLGEWITFYTWDVVGAITFTKPLGYLAAGHDSDHTLANAEKALDYFSWVGCIPSLDHWFDKNPVYRLGPPGFGGVVGISIQRLIDRYQGNDKSYHDPAKPDYLDKFIEAKLADPDNITDNQVVSWLMINLIAGADTTAIIIRSAIYYSLKNPHVWSRLRDELHLAGLTKDTCPLPYKQTRQVTYLEALVRESLRILPGVSGTLERYVPPGGQRLPDGSFVPENCILGFNPYVLARNRKVWGDDADEFKPERWLRNESAGETEQEFHARLREMNNADLSFGGGGRICLGMHLGLLQVYKVVATLAVMYDVELVHPEKEWKVINSFFPRQEGLEVRMRKRV